MRGSLAPGFFFGGLLILAGASYMRDHTGAGLAWQVEDARRVSAALVNRDKYARQVIAQLEKQSGCTVTHTNPTSHSGPLSFVNTCTQPDGSSQSKKLWERPPV